MVSRILVVDDEVTICNLLTRVLEKEGYEVLRAITGQEALAVLSKGKPDLMILDLNLPDLTGENIYESVRLNSQSRDIPILILTGRLAEGLSAKCLNGGADAFLAKPFDTQDLLAHVRALLRRSKVYLEEGAPIEMGGMSIQTGSRQVHLKGVLVEHLSPKEFDVLKELVLRSPQVVGKADLAAKVWGTPLDQLHPRTLDVHIRRIRQKIGRDGARSLKTVSSIGYQWLGKPK